MLKEKTGIGSGLLFMVLFVSMFSFGVMQSPYVAAKYIGNNGYWGFFLAFCVAIPVITVICRLGKRFPRKSVIQYLPEVMGTSLGRLFGFVYLALIMMLTIWMIRAISEQIHVYFLQRTPLSVIVFIFFFVATYIAYQGVEGIARLAAFIFPLTFLLSFMAIGFSFQNFEFDNIRPVFLVDGFKIPLGSLYMFYPFISLLTILTIYPYLTEKHKSFKVITGAASLTFVIILLVIISGIGSYSAPGMLRYSWPVLELTRRTNIPFVLQTFGLFYAATWLSQALVGTGFFYYVLSQGISELLNGLNYKWFTLILFPITYILVMLPSSVIDIRVVFPYERIIGFAVSLCLPLIIWLFAVLRKRGVSK